MKLTQFKKQALSAIVAAAGVGTAISASAAGTGPDFSSLTTGIDFSSVITGIISVASTVITVYIAMRGAKWVIGMVRGA